MPPIGELLSFHSCCHNALGHHQGFDPGERELAALGRARGRTPESEPRSTALASMPADESRRVSEPQPPVGD